MKYPFFILSFCLSSIVFAQQQLTLEQCIAIALENNLNVKQQELNKQNREIAYNQARADLLPNLNASAGQNFVYGRSIGLDNTYQNTNSSQTSLALEAILRSSTAAHEAQHRCSKSRCERIASRFG